MLYKENGEWKLSTKKIIYEENNEEVENFIKSEGENWWEEYSNKWGITIKDVVDLIYSEEQLIRLSEIRDIPDIPEGFSNICSDYVINGNFPLEVNHPLRDLQLSKTIERLNNENFTLMVALAETYEELQVLKGVN